MRLSDNEDTLFWGPYTKDPTISGYYIRVPYFRNTQIRPPPRVCLPSLLRGRTSEDIGRQPFGFRV